MTSNNKRKKIRAMDSKLEREENGGSRQEKEG